MIGILGNFSRALCRQDSRHAASPINLSQAAHLYKHLFYSNKKEFGMVACPLDDPSSALTFLSFENRKTLLGLREAAKKKGSSTSGLATKRGGGQAGPPRKKELFFKLFFFFFAI